MFTFDKYSIKVLKDREFYLIKEMRELPYVPVKSFPYHYFVDMYYVLYFLCLFFKTEIQILERKTESKRLLLRFLTNKDLDFLEDDFEKAFEKVVLMQKDLEVAYLNSCSAFHSALRLENSNHSTAFVLLVVAIESLANTYYRKGSHGERFKRFFADFVPENKRFLTSELRYVERELTREETGALFVKLLTSVYGRVRSGFAHFGKESPVASMTADKLQLAYVKTYRKLNPGLRWFKRLVAEALINFLFSQEIKERNDIHSLLQERFKVKVKARKDIKKYEPITPENIYLQ